MMKKRLLAAFSAAVISGALLAGCGGADASAGGEKNELIVAISSEPKSLDPLGANDNISTLCKHPVFDSLVTKNAEGEIAPALAESWEYVDDTTLNLKLREGVKFHNGEAFDSGDVLFTLENAIDNSYLSWIAEGVDIDNCVASDDYNISIKLLEPNGAFLDQLAYLYIVDEKTYTEMGPDEFANHPIGTGPFAFGEWFRGDRIEYTTNKDYWGTVADFDKLIVRVIIEASSRAIEIESGGVDVALDLTSTDVANLEGNENVKIDKIESYSNQYIGFNCAKEPFNNMKLRQAINYAIDKESIVKAVYGDNGVVADGPMPSSIWGYNENLKPSEYNIEKAKELMKEAGYENGLSTTITTSDSQTRTDTAEILQNQLGQIGINVEVEVLENATYLDRILDGSVEMFILGNNIETGEAGYALDSFNSASPEWSNTSRYSNSEVDALHNEANASIDDELRLNNYAKAQEIIAEEVPWIFLENDYEVLTMRSNVNGLSASPNAIYDFNTATFE